MADRRRLRSVRAGLAVIAAAMRTFAGFGWRSEAYEFVTDRPAFDLLMGGPQARLALEAGAPLDEACPEFEQAPRALARRTAGLLLYKRERGPLAAAGAR